MNWSEPFSHPFMVEAFWLGALVSVTCAVFSCFLVLKGWSLMGDAISHAALPGIVIAHLLGMPLALGALAAALACSSLSQWITRSSSTKEDTAMGIAFSALFALGLVLYSRSDSELHLSHILFGNILGIEASARGQTIVASCLSLLVVLGRRRDLTLFCFDPVGAQAIGLNCRLLNLLLLATLGALSVAAMQAVGILLVVAMLITPGCTALLLCKNMGSALVVAAASAAIASTLGIYLSFFIDAATGPCMVLAQGLCFVLALLLRRLRLP